jgi:hypothetical protein
MIDEITMKTLLSPNPLLVDKKLGFCKGDLVFWRYINEGVGHFET